MECIVVIIVWLRSSFVILLLEKPLELIPTIVIPLISEGTVTSPLNCLDTRYTLPSGVVLSSIYRQTKKEAVSMIFCQCKPKSLTCKNVYKTTKKL